MQDQTKAVRRTPSYLAADSRIQRVEVAALSMLAELDSAQRLAADVAMYDAARVAWDARLAEIDASTNARRAMIAAVDVDTVFA